jgi:phage baseplate assembly protein W
MANAINLRFPLRRSAKGAFETNNSTIEAVTDDLRILILTNNGERPIHFDFGANLRNIVFEQGSDVRQKIEDSIISAVEKWMPFVTLNNVTVNDSSTDSTLRANEARVKIEFSVNQIQGVLTQQIKA